MSTKMGRGFLHALEGFGADTNRFRHVNSLLESTI